MRTIFAIVAISFASCAAACDNSLEGKWQSDAVTSMSFNRRVAHLPDHTDRFLRSHLGRMTIEFKDGRVRTFLPPRSGAPSAADESHYGYRVVRCGPHWIETESLPTELGPKELNVFHFEGKDLYWVSLPVGSRNGKQLREYFRRQR